MSSNMMDKELTGQIRANCMLDLMGSGRGGGIMELKADDNEFDYN